MPSKKSLSLIDPLELAHHIAEDCLQFCQRRQQEDEHQRADVSLHGSSYLKQRLRENKSKIILSLTFQLNQKPPKTTSADQSTQVTYADIRLALTEALHRLKIETESINHKSLLVPVSLGKGKSERLLEDWLKLVNQFEKKMLTGLEDDIALQSIPDKKRF